MQSCLLTKCIRRLQLVDAYAFSITFFLLLILYLFSPTPVCAAIQWSISVVEGYYLPNLTDLNYVLKHELVELGPRNTEAKPSSYPVIYQGISPEMPEMSPKSPKLGLQCQADINPLYAIVFGGSIASFDSTKRDIRPFFVGFKIDAIRETRFSLVLNQFWLGAKRYWIFEKSGSRQVPGASVGGSKAGEKEGETGKGEDEGDLGIGRKPGPRLYAEMGILAVTRAYLTTDLWLHVSDPEQGFDFYKVTETGISGNGYATYLGAGGEYYVNKWLSIGLDIDYTIGRVGDMKFVSYFTVDPLEEDIIKAGDDVLYTDYKKGRIRPLFLDLEGWDFKGQIRFYF